MTSLEDAIPLSALQHFVYCPRQCALIHMDRCWTENVSTAEGRALHEKAHSGVQEKRGERRMATALFLSSVSLGLFGQADVVEFVKRGERWVPFPVEYKRGGKKKHNADRVQLCAQALCLEEMLGEAVTEGALFYGKTHRRESVSFTAALRQETKDIIEAAHALLAGQRLPAPVNDGRCTGCSLKDDCLPSLSYDARRYLEQLRVVL